MTIDTCARCGAAGGAPCLFCPWLPEGVKVLRSYPDRGVLLEGARYDLRNIALRCGLPNAVARTGPPVARLSLRRALVTWLSTPKSS